MQVADEWYPKFEYAEDIPCLVAAAFGAFCGYTLVASKRIIMEGFEAFEKIPRDDMKDPISIHYFGKQSVVSQQLHHFGANPTTDLRLYVEAFVDVQERAMCGNSEKYTESEHKKIKHAQQRGLRYAKPAYTGARKRQPQVTDSIEKPHERDWILQNWNSRTIYSDLLAHKITKTACDKLTVPQRLAKIYGYERTQMFEDTKGQDKSIAALRALRIQARGADVVTMSKLVKDVVFYLKNHFVITGMFSVPRALFNFALVPATESPDDVSELEWLHLFEARAETPVDFAIAAMGGRTFFEVVDPRPESKVQISLNRRQRDSTTHIQVNAVSVNGAAGSTLHLGMQGRLCYIDVLQWCSYGKLGELLGSLRAHGTALGNIHINTLAVADANECGAMLTPPLVKVGGQSIVPLGGVDCLSIVPLRDKTDVRSDGVLRVGSLQLVRDLILSRAFTEFTTVSAVGDLVGWTSEAEDELVSWGMVERMTRDGITTLSLRLARIEVSCVRVPVISDLVSNIFKPGPRRPFAKFGRLELVRYLLSTGWSSVVVPNVYRKGRPKFFPTSFLACELLHLQALALSPTIFEKPGNATFISHTALSIYYKLLFTMDDLSSMAALNFAQIRDMGQDGWKAFANGLGYDVAGADEFDDEAVAASESSAPCLKTWYPWRRQCQRQSPQSCPNTTPYTSSIAATRRCT